MEKTILTLGEPAEVNGVHLDQTHPGCNLLGVRTELRKVKF